MQAMEIQEHARRLLDTFGNKAIAEAAQKAKSLEESGDTKAAEDWRRIEQALMHMRGPHAS